MDKKTMVDRLSDILPERQNPLNFNKPHTDIVEEQATQIIAQQDAKEIARLKYREKKKLQREEEKMEELKQKKEELAESLGLDSSDDLPDNASTVHQAKALYEQKKKVEVIEEIEAETVNPLSPTSLAERQGVYSSKITQGLQMMGPSRGEITKLLTALNINMSVQLSKQDTANLLACLLTCTETQLQALYSNKKVPIAIKAVIKRLLDDTKIGNIETVEKLWDRIFGKAAMTLNLPQDQQLETGIIPNTPVSREAYIIIRDKMLK